MLKKTTLTAALFTATLFTPLTATATTADSTNQQPDNTPTATKNPQPKPKLTRKERRQQKASRTRETLVRVGFKHLGNPYVAGGSGPRVFDCSGFTMYLYKKVAGKNLPHYSGAQMNRGKRVSIKHLQPGDLLFFGPGGSQHVSMYIGKNKMIHATNPRTDVRIDSIHSAYWRPRFAGARRILPAMGS